MVRPRRQRPPSLLGTAARTAVVAGTAASVSGSVAANQRAAEAQKQQLAAAQAQAQQAAIDEAAARAVTARRRGHNVTTGPDWTMKVGGMQGVAVDRETGIFTGGCDPRRDGYCVPA